MSQSIFIYYTGKPGSTLSYLRNWIADRIETSALYDDQRGEFTARAINNALALRPGASMQWGGVVYQICEAVR